MTGKSPVPLRKAVKNDVEIAGMKEAHMEDGLAMEKFLYWLDMEMTSGNIVTEWDAAMKLDSLRAEIQAPAGTVSRRYQRTARARHFRIMSLLARLQGS